MPLKFFLPNVFKLPKLRRAQAPGTNKKHNCHAENMPTAMPSPSPLSMTFSSSTTCRASVDQAMTTPVKEVWPLPVFDSHPSVRLSDFELLSTLGTGTFGRVRLARQCRSQQYYAIKVLKKAEVVRLKQVEHLVWERQVLSELRFPFIIQLFYAFQDTHKLYMVEEYAIGGELFRYLRRVGRFTARTAQFYAAEIVLALEYMHSKNVIYRDLKPENLLLDCDGHIKVADFGFAKKVEDRTWTLCGTPEYTAPEIIQGHGHSKAVDWWAFGILIYEMLTGHPPFYGESHIRIYERILRNKVRYPLRFDSAAKDLIKQLLVVDRTRRLGNLHGGVNDIKQHKFFDTVSWSSLLQRAVQAPFIPEYQCEGDTRNFEKYEEEPFESDTILVDDPFFHFQDFNHQ